MKTSSGANRHKWTLSVLSALLLSCIPAAQAQQRSLSQGQSPMKNFQAHSENKCPNEWKDYQADKREPATPQISQPIGLPSGAPEGTSGHTFDDGAGIQTNPVGNSIKTKTSKDQAGVSQQTALSVPQGGPQPVTSSSGDMTATNMTQPFLRPATMTGSEAERTTIDCRFKRNAAPLGSTMAAAAPASNATQSGSQLWANLPCTANGATAAMMTAFGDQYLSAATNPAANALKAKADQQIKNMQNSDNQGNMARENTESSFESIVKPLINIANEDAAEECEENAAYKSESNVIWMVQQLYKKCYLPMAVLFLLPGAVLTQLKSLVANGFSTPDTRYDEDSINPFTGITRAIVAIFLIPVTQLAVSYCIDIGNALTEPIAKQVQEEMDRITHWTNEQAYASNPSNQDNTIRNVSSAEAMGKLMGTPSSQVVQERQSDLTVSVQNTLNTINAMLSQGLNVLNGFQLVMMCYLFLLGPIAAALFAWPTGVGSGLFRKAFGSWLDGVIVLCLWKFWWCILLLCMAVRLSNGIDENSQYEMYYYTAFMGILVMVPFRPFDFKPGDIVSSVLEKAQGGSGGGGGGGGSSGGGSSGGGSKGSSNKTSSSAGSQNQTSKATQASANGSSDTLGGDDMNSQGAKDDQKSKSGASQSAGSSQPVSDPNFSVDMNGIQQPPITGQR